MGNSTSKQRFTVVDRLATDVILGCEYCDDHVEAIRPRKREVVLDDGTVIPIVRRPSTRAKDAVPLPAGKEMKPSKTSPRVWATKRCMVPAGHQCVVQATCQLAGTVTIRSADRLYERNQCVTASGVATVQPNVPFKVLIANYSDKPVWILPKQLIGYADPEPVFTVESCFTIGELLDVDGDGNPKPPSDNAGKPAQPIKSMTVSYTHLTLPTTSRV